MAGGVYMDISIDSDFSTANLDEMKEVYASVGWTNHTKEIIKQVFEASNVIARRIGIRIFM